MQFPQPIVKSLIIYDNGGNPAVAIGPGPMITIYSTAALSGNIEIGPDATTGFAVVRFWNHNHTKFSQISSNDIAGPGNYPLIGVGPYSTANNDFVGGNNYAGESDFGSVLRNSASVAQFAIFGNETFSGGGIFFFDHTATAPNQAVQWNKATGYLQCADDTWYDITLFNGWTNRGGSWANLSYQFQPDGTVLLRGSIENGAAGSGTQIGAIADPRAQPVTYDKVYSVASDDANGFGVGSPRVQIQPSGDMFIYDTGFGPLYFDGIVWSVVS